MTDINIHRLGFKYGMIGVAILMGFKNIEYALFSYEIPLGIYLGIVSVSFLGIGIWMGISFYREEKLITRGLTDTQHAIERSYHID